MIRRARHQLPVRESYEAIVARNLRFVEELEELSKARREVLNQLGLEEEGLEEALTFQWLLRLYARKVGEPRLVKLLRELLRGGR